MKARNPMMFQFINQAQRNKSNPVDLFKEITKGYKPEQIEGIFNQARQFGIGDDVINKLK